MLKIILLTMLTISSFQLCSTVVESAEVITLLGNGKADYTGDGGKSTEATCNEPFGVVVGPDGALYVCETKNHVIRRIDLDSLETSTVAGTGKSGYSGDGGIATEAELFEPYEVRFDSQGNMIFVEMMNHIVRGVDAKTGAIATLAGTGKAGFAGDGQVAIKAMFNRPHSIAFDDKDNLYICDISNNRLRVVNPQTRIVKTILGDGKKQKLPENAKLGDIPVSGPRALDYDGQNLWLALREGNAIYRIDLKTSRIHHVAGTGGKQGYSGDGGPAAQAQLAGPKGIAVDKDGNVVFADTESHTIRWIDGKTGVIKTIVGNGKKGDGPDGDPLNCKLNRPHSVCFGPDGRVYIGDSSNHRVRVWIP